jgi:hypothetical protein
LLQKGSMKHFVTCLWCLSLFFSILLTVFFGFCFVSCSMNSRFYLF